MPRLARHHRAINTSGTIDPDEFVNIVEKELKKYYKRKVPRAWLGIGMRRYGMARACNSMTCHGHATA